MHSSKFSFDLVKKPFLPFTSFPHTAILTSAPSCFSFQSVGTFGDPATCTALAQMVRGTRRGPEGKLKSSSVGWGVILYMVNTNSAFSLFPWDRKMPFAVSSNPGSYQAKANASVRTVGRRLVGNRYLLAKTRSFPTLGVFPDGGLWYLREGIYIQLVSGIWGFWSEASLRGAESFKR